VTRVPVVSLGLVNNLDEPDDLWVRGYFPEDETVMDFPQDEWDDIRTADEQLEEYDGDQTHILGLLAAQLLDLKSTRKKVAHFQAGC
jgi:hypothetical protein